MTLQTTLVFAAASVVFLAVPGRGAKLIIACRRAGGRGLATAAAIGTAIGQTAMATLALFGLYRLSLADPTLLPQFRWVSGAVLMVLALRLWRAPLHIGPMADNDNLPHKAAPLVVAESAKLGAINLRSLVFVSAMGVEVSPASVADMQLLIALPAVFGLAVLSTSILQALFAPRVEAMIRRRSMRLRRSIPGKTVLIAGRAVSAGYRRIAA